MRWFVFSPSSDFGEPEFECNDDSEGQANVLEYLLDPDSSFNNDGYELDEVTVIRGERYNVLPPKDKHQLVKVGK